MAETVTPHLTPDVATWLRDLVARQSVEVGHPDARSQSAAAWQALDQLDQILRSSTDE